MNRRRLVSLLAVAANAAGYACSGGTPEGPVTPSSAAIVARAPASTAARLCLTCVVAGDLEARVDLVIEETAGVAGEVTGITVLLSNATTVFEGPGTFDREVILRFGAPTTRIDARGSLRIPQIGVHFPGSLRDRLPATLRFTILFRDANGNSLSADASIQVTPP